jgi:hypothetical protein
MHSGVGGFGCGLQTCKNNVLCCPYGKFTASCSELLPNKKTDIHPTVKSPFVEYVMDRLDVCSVFSDSRKGHIIGFLHDVSVAAEICNTIGHHVMFVSKFSVEYKYPLSYLWSRGVRLNDSLWLLGLSFHSCFSSISLLFVSGAHYGLKFSARTRQICPQFL